MFFNLPIPRPFRISFLLPSWRAVQSYRPHLEEMFSWGECFDLKEMKMGIEGFTMCKTNLFDHPLTCPFLISFLLRSWRAVRSCRPHLEERFSSAVRQMPGDLCPVPRIISLSPLSLVTDVIDAALGARGLWLGTRTGASGTATLTDFFCRSPFKNT